MLLYNRSTQASIICEYHFLDLHLLGGLPERRLFIGESQLGNELEPVVRGELQKLELKLPQHAEVLKTIVETGPGWFRAFVREEPILDEAWNHALRISDPSRKRLVTVVLADVLELVHTPGANVRMSETELCEDALLYVLLESCGTLPNQSWPLPESQREQGLNFMLFLLHELILPTARATLGQKYRSIENQLSSRGKNVEALSGSGAPHSETAKRRSLEFQRMAIEQIDDNALALMINEEVITEYVSTRIYGRPDGKRESYADYTYLSPTRKDGHQGYRPFLSGIRNLTRQRTRSLIDKRARELESEERLPENQISALERILGQLAGLTIARIKERKRELLSEIAARVDTLLPERLPADCSLVAHVEAERRKLDQETGNATKETRQKEYEHHRRQQNKLHHLTRLICAERHVGLQVNFTGVNFVDDFLSEVYISDEWNSKLRMIIEASCDRDKKIRPWRSDLFKRLNPNLVLERGRKNSNTLLLERPDGILEAMVSICTIMHLYIEKRYTHVDATELSAGEDGA